MANIASGESDLTRSLDTHGRDEVTQLAQHFNSFTAKLRQVVGQLQMLRQRPGPVLHGAGQQRQPGPRPQPATVAADGTGGHRHQ